MITNIFLQATLLLSAYRLRSEQELATSFRLSVDSDQVLYQSTISACICFAVACTNFDIL